MKFVQPASRFALVGVFVAKTASGVRVGVTGAKASAFRATAIEQAQGRAVDFRADLYSLGVVLFEVFTGRLPFAGEAPTAALIAHIQKQPPRPRSM